MHAKEQIYHDEGFTGFIKRKTNQFHGYSDEKDDDNKINQEVELNDKPKTIETEKNGESKSEKTIVESDVDVENEDVYSKNIIHIIQYSP